VNLGAGLDTRAYRLQCFLAFRGGCFEVDMEVVNNGKRRIFAEFLGAPTPYCRVRPVSLDFLDAGTELRSKLREATFDDSKPAVFLSEGLVMYLGAEGQAKFISDVTAAAARGSVLVLQFLGGSDVETDLGSFNMLSVDKAERLLTDAGWAQLEFSRFGDERLNFGRFPTQRFEPTPYFSFVVCVKT